MTSDEDNLGGCLPPCEWIEEYLTKSDEERMMEVQQEMQNLNGDVVDDPHDVKELVAIIDAGKKRQNLSSQLPESVNLLGDYGFNVDFSNIVENNGAYSILQDKIYVARDTPYAITFTTHSPVPINFCLRVMSVFVESENSCYDVHRCFFHAFEDFNNGIKAPDHVIRCENHPGKYVRNKSTHRRSLLLPYNTIKGDHLRTTHTFRFMCFSSCPGGMNSRPIKVIFSLENSGIVVGRRSVDVKICACPTRDFKNEDARIASMKKANSSIPRHTILPSTNTTLREVNHTPTHQELDKENMLENYPVPDLPMKQSGSKRKRETNTSHDCLIDVLRFIKETPISNEPSDTDKGPYVLKVQDKEEYDLLMKAKAFYEFAQWAADLHVSTNPFKSKKNKK